MDHKKIMARLNRTMATIDGAYAAIAKKYGLTYNGLMAACLIADTTAITQKQIGDALQLSKSTVHSILMDFVKQDQVVFTAGANKKEKYLHFTEAGTAFFAPVLKETDAFEERILSALGETACEQLVRTATELEEIIAHDGKIKEELQ